MGKSKFPVGPIKVGSIWKDTKGEYYLRVADLSPYPKPWRFIDVPGGVLEPRDEDFPHKPLTWVATLD